MKNKYLSKKTKAEKKLEKKLESDLTSSKFRILNEKLYTMSSEDAFNYFKENKEDFKIYHKGFSFQSEKWPINPNELILKTLKLKKYKKKIIADIGCGEAFLAKNLIPLGYKIYSFDLVSINNFVTVANMKNIPLKDKEIDIGIFCLSLMNKNFIPFIVEANRILKIKGKLLVAEINSRIVDLDKFILQFKLLKFKLIKKVNVKDFFTILSFKKIGDVSLSKNIEDKDNTFDILKPCLYKKR